MNHTEQILNYENSLSELFKALGLSPALCQFVRALIIASNGRRVFKIAHNDLAMKYRKGSSNEKNDKQNVRNRINALEKWQKANQIQLVRITLGARERVEKGQFKFRLTEFELVLIGELASLLHSTSESDLDVKINQAIENLKNQFQPRPKQKQWHSREKIERAKKTMLTKMKKIFELWQKANETNPAIYCREIVENLGILVTDLEKEYIHAQNKKKRIRDFERLRNNPQKESPSVESLSA